jgi:hypothetical protein
MWVAPSKGVAAHIKHKWKEKFTSTGVLNLIFLAAHTHASATMMFCLITGPQQWSM